MRFDVFTVVKGVDFIFWVLALWQFCRLLPSFQRHVGIIDNTAQRHNPEYHNQFNRAVSQGKKKYLSYQVSAYKILAKQVIQLSFLPSHTGLNIRNITVQDLVNNIYKVNLMDMLRACLETLQITYNILAISINMYFLSGDNSFRQNYQQISS